jgi:hypothetical protein
LADRGSIGKPGRNVWEEMEMKGVEELDVFKLAHQLALKTYSTTKVFPRDETFGLAD